MSPSDALAEVITGIHSAPQGPGVAAFFDFDGTVMDGFSARAFYRERLLHFEIGPVEAAQTLLAGLRGLTSEEDFERFVAISFAAWEGRSEDELTELGERLFVQQIASRLFPEIWELVAAHQQRGHTVVLASSATRFQVEPAARALGVEHVLCTPLEVVGGVLTGRAAGPTLWRNGKADAVRSFGQEHDIDLAQSYAYSNGDEDVPFLSAAGNPHVVNPEDRLAETAANRAGRCCASVGAGARVSSSSPEPPRPTPGCSRRWARARRSASSTAVVVGGWTPRCRWPGSSGSGWPECS